jgi:hypothetical protein
MKLFDFMLKTTLILILLLGLQVFLYAKDNTNTKKTSKKCSNCNKIGVQKIKNKKFKVTKHYVYGSFEKGSYTPIQPKITSGILPHPKF